MIELGQAWNTVWTTGRDGTIGIPYRVRDRVQIVHFRSAWGARGPLRVELIQAEPGTIWAANGSTYMHHLGYGVKYLALEARRLRLGLEMELTRAGGRAGSVNAFGYFRFPSGMLIELLAEDVD